jgi:TIGR03009 family protein
MAHAQLDAVLRHLRSVHETHALAEASDAQLLDRFTGRREEAAFATLLRRHGPMVLGVSRRVVHRVQDAEDVYQATFLLLARKAGAIRKRESVASWLHGVAHRLALRLKEQTIRRHAREKQAADMRTITPAFLAARHDLESALDAALDALPERYKSALVLCYLEGKSHQEAAQRLGCPLTTLRTHIARGRKLLRDRLTRYGLTLSAGGVASLLLGSAAPAAAPAVLANKTVANAVAIAAGQSPATVCTASVAGLVEGIGKSMIKSNLKVVALLLVGVSAVTAGTGAMALVPGEPQQEPAIAQSGVQTPEQRTPRETKTPTKEEAPQAVALDPDDPLDMALLRWQKAIDKIATASCQVSRTDANNTLKHVDILEGTFKYKKPRRWVLELRHKDKQELLEKWIRDGMLLHQYAPDTKEILEHDLRSDALIKFVDLHRVIHDSSIGFLVGMRAEDAKRNYALTITKGKEDDPYYVYIDIKPRRKRDEADFQEARLVLNKRTYLPRQFWFRHPNGDETTWDIPKIETGVKLIGDEFKLVVPEGWKVNRLPRDRDGGPQEPRDE